MGSTKDRLMRSVRIDEETGCWEWTGHKHSGYGRTSTNGVPGYKPNGSIGAHRAMYLSCGKKIPKGLHLDHLCNNPGCVNPDHLEPVTSRENIRRAVERRTHCRNGHEIKPENIYVRPDGTRWCRLCQLASMSSYAHGKRLEKHETKISEFAGAFPELGADLARRVFEYFNPRPALKTYSKAPPRAWRGRRKS